MTVQYQVVQRLLGYLLMSFSLTMLPPLTVSLWTNDGEAFSFLYAFMLLLAMGVVLWFMAIRNAPGKPALKLRDGFIVVALFWVGLGLAAAIPLYLSPTLALSGTDAAFEAISGLTTTGATVLTGIDSLPWSILFYRQFLQWLGGLGIVVLAVAILPLLQMGGMQLYHAEAPHSLSERRLTPRITETAKQLWYLYLGLTAACFTAYWIGGMTPFDALAHAFSTIAIGGFSTHDANFGYFNNAGIEAVAIVFMILAGVNFGLHYAALSRFSARLYLRDGEFRTYATILLSVAILCVSYLWLSGFYDTPVKALQHGVFQTVSMATTTGFTTTGYNHWPAFASTLLLLVSFIGGCMGSTGGGMKVIRFLLLIRYGGKELKRILHPSARVTVRVGDRVMTAAALQTVWGFFAAYVTIFTMLLLLFMMTTGYDHVTAFSAIAATLNNLGPGLGEVSVTYAQVGDFGKWLLCLSMLFGRLEIFTLLIVLTPAFWRK